MKHCGEFETRTVFITNNLTHNRKLPIGTLSKVTKNLTGL